MLVSAVSNFVFSVGDSTKIITISESGLLRASISRLEIPLVDHWKCNNGRDLWTNIEIDLEIDHNYPLYLQAPDTPVCCLDSFDDYRSKELWSMEQVDAFSTSI